MESSGPSSRSLVSRSAGLARRASAPATVHPVADADMLVARPGPALAPRAPLRLLPPPVSGRPMPEARLRVELPLRARTARPPGDQARLIWRYLRDEPGLPPADMAGWVERQALAPRWGSTTPLAFVQLGQLAIGLVALDHGATTPEAAAAQAASREALSRTFAPLAGQLRGAITGRLGEVHLAAAMIRWARMRHAEPAELLRLARNPAGWRALQQELAGFRANLAEGLDWMADAHPARRETGWYKAAAVLVRLAASSPAAIDAPLMQHSLEELAGQAADRLFSGLARHGGQRLAHMQAIDEIIARFGRARGLLLLARMTSTWAGAMNVEARRLRHSLASGLPGARNLAADMASLAERLMDIAQWPSRRAILAGLAVEIIPALENQLARLEALRRHAAPPALLERQIRRLLARPEAMPAFLSELDPAGAPAKAARGEERTRHHLALLDALASCAAPSAPALRAWLLARDAGTSPPLIEAWQQLEALVPVPWQPG